MLGTVYCPNSNKSTKVGNLSTVHYSESVVLFLKRYRHFWSLLGMLDWTGQWICRKYIGDSILTKFENATRLLLVNFSKYVVKSVVWALKKLNKHLKSISCMLDWTETMNLQKYCK